MKSIKKIAIFHNFMDNIGGAEIVGLTLARELNADFYTTNIDEEKIEKMGFPDIKLKSIGKVPVNAPFRQQATLRKFRKLNLKNKYDFNIIAGDWAMSEAVNNKPNLWYVHSPIREIWDLYEDTRKNKVTAWKRPLFDIWVRYNRYLNKRYIRHVNKIACNSKNTQNRVRKYLGRNATVIHPPIETKEFRYIKNGNFWLSVNRLLSYKRVDMQIKAFQKLPDEKLIIVGSYEQARHFKKYVAYINKIKPKNVEVLHWVDRKRLIDLYSNCKGFITTSQDEDFGMAPLEAMASGKPVIAPNEGGYKETVIDNVTGKLIDGINADKLVQAINEIGKNPEKYKDACLKRAKGFDTEVFIREISEKIETMKTLFLSHDPHEVHRDFAREINAKIKTTPFKRYIILIKKYPFLSYLYPIISLIYSLFVNIKEDILLVDGSSSLYIAVFLKMRNKNLKIIYLSGDLGLYNLLKTGGIHKKIMMSFIKKIDGVIAVSGQNREYAAKCLKVPIEVCYPYPKNLKKENITRKNYGLYIGRLDPDKNIKRIIDFGLSCPHFEKFIIIGDGALKGYVQKICKRYKKIVYEGIKKNVGKYYSECKFLIHIPDADPHPCTPMEAAICGCYPIISKGVGARYIFDKIFVVNEADNFNEINEMIKYISENGEEANGLLAASLNRMLTREQSVENFKNKFNAIIRCFSNSL